MTTNLTQWFDAEYQVMHKDDGLFSDGYYVMPSMEELTRFFASQGFDAENATLFAERVSNQGFTLADSGDRTFADKDMIVQTSMDFDAQDLIITAAGKDQISTGGGDDLVISGDDHDIVNAGSGNDVIFGGNDHDQLFGGDGDDWIFGDAQIKLDQGIDVTATVGGGVSLAASMLPFGPFGAFAGGVAGLLGGLLDKNNQITTEDVLNGTRFMDSTEDETAYIALDDESGNDVIHGGAGDDVIIAGRGADLVMGGDGNDVIDPGARGEDDNRDIVIGGAGEDVFYLGSYKGQDAQAHLAILNMLKTFSETRPENVTDLFVEESAGAPDDSGELLPGLGRDELLDMGQDIAIAAAGEVFGQIPGGATVLETIQQFVSWATDDDAPVNSGDYVEILDFNPEEDVLAIPMSNGYTVVYRPEITGSGADLSVTLNLCYGLQGPEGSNAPSTTYNTFAVVNLDPAWIAKAEFLQSAGDIERTSEYWTDLLKSAIDIPVQPGVAADDGDGLVSASDNSDTGMSIRLIGNTGPIIRDSSDDVNLAPMVGGASGDILIGDHAGITPGTEDDPTHTSDARFASTEIYGMGGDDTIYGSGQRDKLFGGEGDDTIYSMGTDGVSAEGLYGGSGDDTVYVGRDTFSNYAADGGEGHDTLSFEYRKAETEQWADASGRIEERVGDEGVSLTFRSNDKGDFANYSDDPADRSDGSSFVDFEKIIGSDFNDSFHFGAASEAITLDGGAGDDRLIGGQAADVLKGGAGDDMIWGNSGHDKILGGAGDDKAFGGTGNDRIGGQDGDDLLLGKGGNDKLWGHDGDDNLKGGFHNDALFGGAGDDRLHGGRHEDMLTGGQGSDTFVFKAGDGSDIITDFEIGVDRLVVDTQLLSNATLEHGRGETTLSFSDTDQIVFEGEFGAASIEDFLDIA